MLQAVEAFADGGRECVRNRLLEISLIIGLVAAEVLPVSVRMRTED